MTTLCSNTCSISLSWAGTRKAADCEEDGGRPSCIPCEEAKDYTDRSHFSPRCRRCKICDEEHGRRLYKQSKRPIMGLHVEPCIIQFEIGAYSRTMCAHRKGQHGAGRGEAGPGTRLITCLHICGSNPGNSPRITKYEPGEQGSSAPIKIAYIFFSTLIYALVVALKSSEAF